MIKGLRPHKVFTMITTPLHRRIVKVVLPELHTPKILETAVLIALAKIVKARTFFEFGTYIGVQTLNIAMNLPPSAKIYTLDFDEESYKKVRHQHEKDSVVSLRHFEYEDKLAFLKSPYCKKITRFYGDSNEFDFSEFEGKIDMAYVDGGHDLRTLKSDTQNAFRIMASDHPACIAWHDYKNPDHPQLTQFLDELSVEYSMYHLEETMICFYLKNEPKNTLNMKIRIEK